MASLFLVAGTGFEPVTFGLWAQRAAGLLYPAITLLYAELLVSVKIIIVMINYNKTVCSYREFAI